MAFLRPKIEASPPPPVPAPNSQDPGEAERIRQRQQEAAMNERRQATGRAATLLTGGMGVSAPAPSAKKTLLEG